MNDCMNIATLIQKYADRCKLELCATGGGCDYVIRVIPDPEEDRSMVLVLASADDSGSPDKLWEPSCVTMYFIANRKGDGSWRNGVTINFPSAQSAMDFMASQMNILETDSSAWWTTD